MHENSFFGGLVVPSPEDLTAFKIFNQLVWYPLSKEICDIFYAKSHLLAEDVDEDHHYRLISHYCALVLNNSVIEDMWARQDRKEVLPPPFGPNHAQEMLFFQFPVELLAYFQEKRATIRAEWLRLLSLRDKGMKYKDEMHVRIQTWEEHAHYQRQRSQSASSLSAAAFPSV